ncbi:MAG: hypothetical protein OXI26_06520 [bacterium]|nr:hypothetical protein [bacterium]
MLLIILGGLVVLLRSQSAYFMTVHNWRQIGLWSANGGLVVVGLSVLMIGGGIDSSGVIRRRKRWWTKLLTILLIVALVESWITIVMLATVMISTALINVGVAHAAALLVSFACAMGMDGATAFCKRRLHELRVSRRWAVMGSLLLLLGAAGITVATDRPVVIERPTWWTPWLLGDLSLPLFIFAGVLVSALLFMRYTAAGNLLSAVGASAEVCRELGVKVERIRSGAFMVTALLAGIAGTAFTYWLGVFQSGYVSDYLYVVTAAVLLGGVALAGGQGSLLRAVLCLVIVRVIWDGMLLTDWGEWDLVLWGFGSLAIAFEYFRKGGGEQTHRPSLGCEPKVGL